ncbi:MULTISPECIES: response regulator transcription factor [unclassified Streptomyces]|uniref:response regulator n=1 Tax=unclassified Streptomyces TaxID=2593676 RepID=UPI002741B3D7|nr:MULTISPECIES: response regulator transcription factor [unclassified Streptomyces]
MTRVLVVDDQVLVRSGLSALLRATPDLEVCGEAATGEEAVELAAGRRPDVILMDIRLPGLDGVAATERILAASGEPKPRIIMLTTFDLDELVYAALRVGASGFLLKETRPERLFTAIRAIADGEMLFAPTVTRRLIDTYLRCPSPDVAGAGPLTSLTNRERDVLSLVGQGLSNPEIADRLTVTIATVKTHLNRMMAKLDLSSRAQAVAVAYETGLVHTRR